MKKKNPKAKKVKECLKFGQRLKYLREEMEMTQERLSEKSEVHRTYISGLECGDRNPSLTMICALSKALKVSVSELTEGL